MALSSLTVVGNSILLGRYRPKLAPSKPENEQIYTEKELKAAYAEAT
jgi:hypothetical protein